MSTDLHDLHELMDRALTGLDVPTDRIGAGSLARGRAVRRRRRAAGALAGAAAVALAAGLAVPSLAGTDDASQRIAQDTGEPSPDSYVRPAGWWDMPGSVMLDRLDDLLPSGASIADPNLGDEDLAPGEDPAGGWVQADLLADQELAGGVNVVLYPPFDTSSFAEDATTCPGNAAGAESCTELREDGAVGRIVRYVAQDPAGDVVTLETTWLLPDGGVVYAAVSNSASDKWGAGSSVERPGPPLRPAQLREIAASPLWQDWTPRR